MDLLPSLLVWSLVFIFGVIFGSFANVVVDRLHTGRSLNDRSHCFSCGQTLSWYELFPLLSFIFLLGRCSRCKARIPGRFFLVEFIMGFLFLVTLMKFGLTLIGTLSLVMMFLLLVTVVYDMRHFIIPNELVILVMIVGLLIVFVREGLWLNPLAIMPFLLGTIFIVSVYGGLWLVSGGRWIGFGDVKLVIGLGLPVGLSLWFSFVVWSFWTGAIVSLIFIGFIRLLKKGTTRLGFLPTSLTMKSEVPFAPFLILAFILVYLFELNVLDLIAYVSAELY